VVFHRPRCRLGRRIAAALNKVRAESRSGKRAPAAIRDVRAELDAMRLVKDGAELAIMRRAAEISTGAHVRAMRFVRPGRFEYEVEAELLHEFRRRGCEYPAYTSIVAGGANACVLHYVGNDQVLKDGDLLLIDAGGELDGYASDITRCFPVNGRFSGPQADVYDLVLDAQAAAIAAVRPGATFIDPHEAALKVLAQGMIDLKLLSGSLDAVIESESYKRFFMHRTSHWLGKDVHDAGEYKEGEHWAPLAPGMVLTIEPGCYIRPGRRRARGLLEHRRAHRGRRGGDGRRLRDHHRRRAEEDRRHRGVDARCAWHRLTPARAKRARTVTPFLERGVGG
jgi:Xaa-Pro aminopeptidase